MNFRDELDAIMKAEQEQIPELQERMAGRRKDPSGRLTVGENLAVLTALSGIHRRALLRIAEEIDRLRGTEEPEP